MDAVKTIIIPEMEADNMYDVKQIHSIISLFLINLYHTNRLYHFLSNDDNDDDDDVSKQELHDGAKLEQMITNPCENERKEK